MKPDKSFIMSGKWVRTLSNPGPTLSNFHLQNPGVIRYESPCFWLSAFMKVFRKESCTGNVVVVECTKARVRAR
ncbi:hypothetical protein Hanom_Chr15g01342071 [Helianthus anomalus]